MGTKTRRRTALAAAFFLLCAACSGEPAEKTPRASPSPGTELVAQVASYDLAVGTQRFTVGLLTQDKSLVGHGQVQLQFGHLGERNEGQTTLGRPVQAKFLAISDDVDGRPPRIADTPQIIRAPDLRGVYGAQATFDRPGYWGVVVTANVKDHGRSTARATFEVRDSHKVPWIGEDAPRTENLTLTSTDAPRTAIDSRASEQGEIPDAELHQSTVAQAIAQKKPVLLVIATPVFCVSRFCGPITDMVSSLSRSYSDRASFVHIEVWWDFEKKQLNPAAAEWIYHDGDAQEPWVFLIGADAKVAARWDNVATRAEIEPLLKKLPPLSPPSS